tara:strand:- start:106 stop:819 length:714 start_codon:yes stop_codon:yes gene_type:complete
MTVNTTAQGNISLNSIKNETNSSNITWSNTSLRSVSSLAGKSIPDAMSEFSGYTHITNHSTTILPDFWSVSTSGGYVQQFWSGYSSGGSSSYGGVGDLLGNGSFPDAGTINFGGLTRNANDIEIEYAYFWGFSYDSYSHASKFQITFRDNSSDHGTSWSNAGFTNIEFYLGQSNTSGSPDLTLARTAATGAYFADGGSSTTMTYMWDLYKPYASYFGNSPNPSTNGYSTINITGLAS